LSVGRRCVQMAAIIRMGVHSLRDSLGKDPLYEPLLDGLEGRPHVRPDRLKDESAGRAAQ
jgi:hypothetical protein